MLSTVALPLSWVWWLASAGGRGLQKARRVSGLTVISVGNLAVGGTGKTPVAAWLVAKLRGWGLHSCLLVGGHADDEAELHRGWHPDVPVLQGSDRFANAVRARAQGVQVAVLDDGFQHRRIGRDADVVLLAAEDAFPGRLLPRGPYREVANALARADAVIVTRRAASAERARRVCDAVERYAPGAARAGVRLEASGWRKLNGRAGCPEGVDALAVCAVGRPRSFESTVRGLLGGEVELMDFADHHEYGAADVARIRTRAAGRPVVVTEKDAVKLRSFADELCDTYVLQDALEWEWGEPDVTRLIEGLVARAVGR